MHAPMNRPFANPRACLENSGLPSKNHMTDPEPIDRRVNFPSFRGRLV